MAAALPLKRSAPAPADEPRRWPRFPLVFAAVLSAVSLLPYLLAYLWTPPGHHFAGFFFIADDATTYLAKMRQGAEGSWLWTDPYTSEPHGGVFLFGFYLLFGHLAGWLHLPLIATYHLARISGGIALVLAADRLCRRLLKPELHRLALVLIILGSGLGFVVQAAGNPSIFGIRIQALDLHLPELTGWYSILAIPHFAWATALIIASLLGLLRIADLSSPSPLRAGPPAHASRRGVAPREPRGRAMRAFERSVRAMRAFEAFWGGGLWQSIALTSAAMIALTAIHPQMIPVLGIIWFAYQAVLLAWGQRYSWRWLLQAIPFATTLPLLAYNAWILFRDPTIAEWASQWRHQAPDPISLVVSLGAPLGLAVIGMVLAWRQRDRGLALMMVWPPLVAALLYLPNLANIQRRLLDALYVPLGILAAVGLRELTARMRPASGRRLRAILVTASCFSSTIVLAIALRFASGAFSEAYVSNDAWRAMQWLSTHHESNDRALSGPGAGQLLPAWSGVSVYVGHYSETLNYFQKIDNVRTVLQPSTNAATFEAFLRANGITLVYWGPDEAKTGFEPEAQPVLQPVKHDGTVTIYRVSP